MFQVLGVHACSNELPKLRVVSLVEQWQLMKEDSVHETELLREETFISVDEGELLVLKCLLSNHEEEEWLQRSIFKTHCTIKKKACLFIIDSGNCGNIVTSSLVKKLNLKMEDHPHPYYTLAWIWKKNELRYLVPFSINILHDHVWCNVVLMDVCHLLLGRT